jgi:hypothetical protein
MIAHALFALDPPAWLTRDLWLPSLVGLAAGLVTVLTIHFFIRPRGRVEAPPPKDEPAFDPFVHGSASEQRAAHRRTGARVEILLRLPGAAAPLLRGWVLDRSVGGLCVAVDQEFVEGTKLDVRPVNAPETTPWVEVTVRSARRTSEGCQLGCQFARTPPWSVLLLFG